LLKIFFSSAYLIVLDILKDFNQGTDFSAHQPQSRETASASINNTCFARSMLIFFYYSFTIKSILSQLEPLDTMLIIFLFDFCSGV